MRKSTSLIGMAGLGLAAMAALSTPSSKATANRSEATATASMKATVPERKKQTNSIVNEIGGLPFVSIRPNYGMSPMEYGMRYGHGNGNGKLNKLRLKHNAKLKRRTA